MAKFRNKYCSDKCQRKSRYDYAKNKLEKI